MESNKALAETICCAFRNSPIVCNHCGIQIVHRQVQEQEHAQTCNVNGTSNQAVAPAPSSQPQTSHTAIGFATARNLNQLATSNPLPQAMTAPAATVEHQYYKQYQQCYQQYPRAYDPYQHQQYYPYQQQLAQQVQQLPQPQVQQQVQAPMPQVLPQPHFHPQRQPHFHPQPQPQVLPQPHFHPQPQPHFHPQPQPQLINSQLPPASHPPYPSQPHQQIQHVPPQQHPLQVQPPFGSLPPQFPPPPPLPHMMPPQQRPITHQVQQPVPPPYMQQPQVFPGQTPSQLQVQPQAHQHLPQSIVQQASTNGVFDAASDFSSGLRKKPDTLSCEICNITCTCSEDLEKHIAGKKHQKKLEESNQGHGVKLVCELCRVTCNTSDMLKNHMSGRNHQKNLEKSKKLIGANPKRKKIESDDDKCVSDDEPETKKHDAMASCKLQAGSKGLQALYPKKQ